MKITIGSPVLVKWYDAQASDWYPQNEIDKRSIINIASIGVIHYFQKDLITIMHNEADQTSDYLTIPIGSVYEITPLIEKKSVKNFKSIRRYEFVKVVWGDAELCTHWIEKSKIPNKPMEVRTYGLFGYYSSDWITIVYSISEDDECVSIQIPTRWIYNITTLKKGSNSWKRR